MRRTWTELPASVRTEIQNRCSAVVTTETPAAGTSSDFSATLHLLDGKVFCKGVELDNPKSRMHRHEARVNAWLPSTAPRLLWTIETGGWLLLGFEHVDGRHADLSPGSPDLPLIANTVATLDLTPCPVDVPSFAEQWTWLSAWRRLVHAGEFQDEHNFVEWELSAQQFVDGDTLLHTDLHTWNIMVGDRVRVLDWAWSRRGAAWVDAGFLVLRLIQAGHDPHAAETWAESIPAWREANDEARTAFAIAVLGVWEFKQRDDPLPHREKLTAAARIWVKHRLGLT
ncbi:phosphotransferase [Lentzea kentuckyensis]|uniref:phosphotransferase n=1 Tax=Lentzea kentuckyensis TaxID=360086 RepID=UPI000A388ACC|nr:phosphotransferase [Lentzea kentuckyensis]